MSWVEIVLNGIFLGSLYGVLGLGLALVFGVMRVINIAHGEFIVLGAYMGVVLATGLPGVSPILFIVPIMLALFAIGWVFQRALLDRAVQSGNLMVPMLLTFGVSIVVRNAMLETFGANPRAIDAGEFARASFQLAGVNIGVMPLSTLLVSIVLFASLHILIFRTQFGRVVRATSDNPQVARLMGVDPRRTHAMVMALALALAGIAGLLLAMRTSFTPASGVDRILIAFEVVVLGGLGSFWGAFLAGVLLGVTQLIGFQFDSNSGLLYAHLLFLCFLVARPAGLFGAQK